MASCQTWSSSSHIRHPWFDPPLMKRKQLDTVSSDEETGPSASESAPASEPPSKRRRCNTLEHGLAHLTLGNPRVGVDSTTVLPASVITTNTKPSPIVLEGAPVASTSTSMDADMALSTPPTTIYPSYIIEEPSVPDVKMKTSSWYEPEPNRIIITDMDGFTESDDEDGESVSVNPVLLDRIRNNTLESRKPSVPSTSQALILYKPLPLVEEERDTIERLKQERRKKIEAENKKRTIDEDAMDTEP